MARRQKQYRILDSLEKDFLSLLNESTLEACEDSKSLFFLATEYNPWSEMKGRTDPKTNVLVKDAQSIINLRSQLGEPENCLALIFLEYCKQYVDTTNANRLGVQKHALALLKEINKVTRENIAMFEKNAT